MTSAIRFNLDQSKILSFCKELNKIFNNEVDTSLKSFFEEDCLWKNLWEKAKRLVTRIFAFLSFLQMLSLGPS